MRPIVFKEMCWTELEAIANVDGIYPAEQETRYLTYLEEDGILSPGAGIITIQSYISPRWNRTAYIVCYQAKETAKVIRLQYDTARMDIAIQQAHYAIKLIMQNERLHNHTDTSLAV